MKKAALTTPFSFSGLQTRPERNVFRQGSSGMKYVKQNGDMNKIEVIILIHSNRNKLATYSRYFLLGFPHVKEMERYTKQT